MVATHRSENSQQHQQEQEDLLLLQNTSESKILLDTYSSAAASSYCTNTIQLQNNKVLHIFFSFIQNLIVLL